MTLKMESAILPRKLAVLCVLALVVAGCSRSSEPETASDTQPAPVFDYGVDPDSRVVRVGVNAELSGPFRWQSQKVVEAHVAYWEWLNGRGGVSGWTVEPVVLDSGYNPAKHVDNYETLAVESGDGVLMFTMSAGTPTTLATVDLLAQDSMAALPLSTYSGWADPDIGGNVFELFASYCVEAMNGTAYMAETYGDRAAVVSLPGPYGADAAEGVKVAVDALGLDVVYDGDGSVVPGDDLREVISEIVASDPDWVWLATDPVTTATLIERTSQLGFDGRWSGNSPSWNAWVLDTDAGRAAADRITVSARTALWDEQGSPGMQEMIAGLRERRPTAPFDDIYALGWALGYAATAVLEQALDSGDLTRAGVLAAAGQASVDFKGLAPNLTWSGEPDDTIVRSSYLYSVSPDEAADLAVTEVGTDDGYPGPLAYFQSALTVSDPGATNGYNLIKGPYTSDTARDWNYRPCHQPQ